MKYKIYKILVFPFFLVTALICIPFNLEKDMCDMYEKLDKKVHGGC